jgi:hypothetical protein
MFMPRQRAAMVIFTGIREVFGLDDRPKNMRNTPVVGRSGRP